MKKRAAPATEVQPATLKRGKKVDKSAAAAASSIPSSITGDNFSSTSNWIFVETDFNVKIVDAVNGETVKIIADTKKAGGRHHFACLNNTGSLLATISMIGLVQVWNVESGELVRELKPPPVEYSHAYCCFNPVRNELAYIPKQPGDAIHLVTVWDVDTGEQKLSLAGHEDKILSVCYSPDGSKIVSSSYDKKIIVWDAETGSKLRTLNHDDNVVVNVVFNPDGSKLASISAVDTLKIWNTTSFECTFNYKSKYYIFEGKFSIDGNKLIVRYQYKLQVLDLENNCQVLFTIDKCKAFSLHCDDNKIAAIDKTAVIVWDSSSGQVLKTIDFPKSACLKAVGFFPDKNSTYLLK